MILFKNIKLRDEIEACVTKGDQFNLDLLIKLAGDDYQAAVDLIIIESIMLKNKEMLIYGLNLDGATPNFKHFGGDPIIFLATLFYSAECMKVLLEYGIDMNVTNSLGESIISNAIRWSNYIIIESNNTIKKEFYELINLIKECDQKNNKNVENEKSMIFSNQDSGSFSDILNKSSEIQNIEINTNRHEDLQSKDTFGIKAITFTKSKI
jgi:hypothetical protein